MGSVLGRLDIGAARRQRPSAARHKKKEHADDNILHVGQLTNVKMVHESSSAFVTEFDRVLDYHTTNGVT